VHRQHGFVLRLGYWLALCLAAMLLLGTAGHAQLPQPGKNAIAASLVPESTVVAPGQTVTLALMMRPAEGWHGYWKNPGDSGIETQIAWELPAGLSAGPIQYPVPDQLMVAGLMNYVYKGDHALLIDVAVPARVAPRTKLPIRARVDYLACTDEICVPETANVAAELEAGSAPAAAADRWRAGLCGGADLLPRGRHADRRDGRAFQRREPPRGRGRAEAER
jgi:DsbC/DsbD-like thiol-disulfide interchange protein